MNGTLSENLEKNLDEALETDFKIMRMLCGEIAAQDVSAPEKERRQRERRAIWKERTKTWKGIDNLFFPENNE